jgi:acyl carrier protein
LRKVIEAELRQIFSVVLGLDESRIVGNLSPDNCSEWDSLAHIHLVTAIQEKYGIALPIEIQVEILSFDLAVLTVIEFQDLSQS